MNGRHGGGHGPKSGSHSNGHANGHGSYENGEAHRDDAHDAGAALVSNDDALGSHSARALRELVASGFSLDGAPSTLDVEALFEGRNLVVLGGTGFVGKLFWVMLLSRYPNLERIYLLVRSNKAKSSEERFWSEVVTSPAFDPLRAAYPEPEAFEAFLRGKIVPIDGDVGRPLCGIDAELVSSLRGRIDAVVNVAGIVDFNPPLDYALEANAFGAKNLVALAEALGHVPLMHTSTCYVAGKRKGPIREQSPLERPFPRCDELGRDAWDPEREIQECLDLIAQVRHRAEDAFRKSEFAESARLSLEERGEPATGEALDAEIARVRRKWVEARLVEQGLDRATHWGWQNIYTYTKSIGEQVIAGSGLPFTIVRPACCESTVAFPFPAWNDGISTSAPIIYLALKGQVHVATTDVPLDFIPTDYVCAGMIMSLAELLEGTAKPVYQYGASDLNPCTAARFGELIGLYKRKYYQRKGTGSPLLNFLQAHYEPAYVPVERFDKFGPPAIAQASRTIASVLRSTKLGIAEPLVRNAAEKAADKLDNVAKREDKIGDIIKLFAPFTTVQNGPFDCSNTRAAFARLAPEDRAKLPWAPEAIDYLDWMMNVHMPAMERWVVPAMDKKMKREKKPLRAHKTLASLVVEMAERHGHALAFQRLEGDPPLLSRITYSDVLRRSAAVAAELRARGIGPGDRVLLSAQNHPRWPIAYFGIVRSGAIAVPVDPAMDADGFRSIVTESGIKVAILDERAEAHARAHEGRERGPGDALAGIEVLPFVQCDAGEERVTDDEARAIAEVDEDDVASIIFTSGTTGRPKGVRLTHKNFTSLIAALAPVFPLGQDDRVLSVLPLHHTFEFTCGLLLPFSRGARVVYLDELSGERVATGMKVSRASAMVGVPALWQLLERRILSEVSSRGAAVKSMFDAGTSLNRMLGRKLGVDLGRVLFGAVHAQFGGRIKYLISGGAALPKETAELFAGLGLHLAEGYGLTEAAPVLTVAPPSAKGRSGQVGRPIPGVEIRIANADEHGVGEVLARGPNVMAGYTDDEATDAVLQNGWLKTGDLGKVDRRGRLSLVGRVKDVIVTTTGENIYPDDVEQRLGVPSHIAELAIVGVDTHAGEKVACLAVPEKDDTLPRAERFERAQASLRLAIAKLPYNQQPAIVQLHDSALPRTATRKVRRNEVRAIVERNLAASVRPSELPSELTRVRLAIATLRGIPAEHLTSSTSLKADLGFDSLLLTELLEILESRGTAIEPASLAACSSVGDVEALVEAAEGGRARKPHVSRTKTIERSEPEEIELPPAVQELGKRVIGKLQDAFYGQAMRAKVYGRAFIPHNRNTIVVSNHSSHLDMGLVRHALGRYGEAIVSLAAQDYFFEGGLKKAFFDNFTNLKAVDRGGTLRATLRDAGEELKRGRTVLIFPEGTRSKSGELQEFKPLIGHLALAHNVDILPLWLGGTHQALPKGAVVPRGRELLARIGPPLRVEDLRRATAGLSPAEAARKAAQLAHEAVAALRDGELFDLGALAEGEAPKEREHPLVSLFQELGTKFRADKVERPVSYYFTLGGDPLAKWTVRVDASGVDIKPGKPDGFQADCVLKTTPEIFTRIVRESYVPGPAEFLSGAIKSNDVTLLQTFQEVFQLSS
jgi:long-chain acyl-CoA synthetase